MSDQTPDVTVNVNVDGEHDAAVTVDTHNNDDVAHLLPEEIAAMQEDDGQANFSDNVANSDADNGRNTNDDGHNDDNRADNNPADNGDSNAQKSTDVVDYSTKLATFADRQADIDARYELNLEAIRNLGEKYNDGDVSEGEYQAELARLQREGRKIEYEEQNLIAQQSQVQTDSAIHQAQIQNDFQSSADAFLAREENSVFVAGSPELQALDQQIQILANTLPPNTTFTDLFDKARAVVSTYMDLPKAGGDNKADNTNTETKPKQPEIPPNLGMMPSAVNNSSMGKFVHLDKLEGVEFDQAFARLSEAEQAEYLRSE